MKLLLKPYWMLLTLTAPQVFIFILYWWIYGLIGSRLDSNNVFVWLYFAVGLGILFLCFSLYSIINIFFKKDVLPQTGLIIIGSYITFLYLFFTHNSKIVPFSIPRWMLFGAEPEIYTLTLIMPSLAYGLLLVVHWLTPEDKKYSFSKDIIIALAVPAFWYVLFTGIMPILRIPSSRTLEHTGFVVFVVSTLCFLFGVTRMVYVLLRNKPSLGQKIITPIVLICPTLGLLLNNNSFKVFGDFSHISFYIFAVITGLLVVIPPFEDKALRLAGFIGKSIMLSYTAYFFIVFLPFIPVSLIAMLIIGSGILMLTPTILAMVHVKSLWMDMVYLSCFYKKQHLVALLVAGVCVLPGSIILSINGDRENLNYALKYVYQRGYNETSRTNLNLGAIERTLQGIKNNKDTRRDLLGVRNHVPYLTAFYNWFVLDNLTLSGEKIKTLEHIFLGSAQNEKSEQTIRPGNVNNDIKINSVRVETVFDEKDKFYKSWIHFELKNGSTALREYVTNFSLPDGCFISDYYLYVNDIKKHGLVSDKRAANWIYQQIVQVQKDPGILYYTSGDRIVFKVFPFTSNEIRKTGIQVIHRNSTTLNIDGNNINLKGSEGKDVIGQPTEVMKNIIYVPPEFKKTLTKVERSPEYHFVLDFSKGNSSRIKDYTNWVKSFINNNQINSSEVKIIAANYEEKTFQLNENWEQEIGRFNVRGGFFLDKVIKRVLFENYISKSPKKPIIIVVTDNIDEAVVSDSYYGFQSICPEDLCFYKLGSDTKLHRCSLVGYKEPSTGKYVEQIPKESVLAWPNNNNPSTYLRDDERSSLVLKDDYFNFKDIDFEQPTWEKAVALNAANIYYILHPEKYVEMSKGIVKSSIESRIMTPLTSFIVLENEAQEKVLLEKQKKLLSSDKPLDASDQTEMSEPSLLILILLISGFIFSRRVGNIKQR